VRTCRNIATVYGYPTILTYTMLLWKKRDAAQYIKDKRKLKSIIIHAVLAACLPVWNVKDAMF